MIPEGTFGKYTIMGRLDGKMVKREPRSTAGGAAALRAKWEAEDYVVEIVEGKSTGLA